MFYKKWRRAYLAWKRLRKRRRAAASYYLWLEIENEKILKHEAAQYEEFLKQQQLEKEFAEDQQKVLMHLLGIQPNPILALQDDKIAKPSAVIFSQRNLLKPIPQLALKPRPRPYPGF